MGVALRDRERGVGPSRTAGRDVLVAGVRLRPRGTFEGAGGSSPAAVGGGVCRGGTGGVGVGTAKTWDPCGVAGIRLKVGGGAGPTVGAGTGTGLLTEVGGGAGTGATMLWAGTWAEM